MTGHLIEFQLDLTYPLELGGIQVCDLEVSVEVATYSDAPDEWSITAVQVEDLNASATRTARWKYLEGDALNEVVDGLVHIHGSLISEKAHQWAQEAA
jgi:hypothetical protein